MTSEAYFGVLMAAYEAYCDCLDYDTWPAIADSYNSNSYIAGLVGATGGRPSIDFGDYAGGNDPVPGRHFGY